MPFAQLMAVLPLRDVAYSLRVPSNSNDLKCNKDENETVIAHRSDCGLFLSPNRKEYPAAERSAAENRLLCGSEHQGTGRYERQQHACYAPSAGRQADPGLRPRRTARTERRHRSEQCKAHHASAGYRGILCAGILRDRPARGQGGINSDSAKNGKEQFFEKDRAISNYQPDAFGLQVL